MNMSTIGLKMQNNHMYFRDDNWAALAELNVTATKYSSTTCTIV